MIIGTKWNNNTIQKIINALPVKFTAESLTFREKLSSRKNLTIGFIYPSLVNSGKYIYFLDSDRLNKELFPRDFTNRAWYDFELFNTDSIKPRLIENGVFNNSWK